MTFMCCNLCNHTYLPEHLDITTIMHSDQCPLYGAKFGWANLQSLFLDCDGHILVSF